MDSLDQLWNWSTVFRHIFRPHFITRRLTWVLFVCHFIKFSIRMRVHSVPVSSKCLFLQFLCRLRRLLNCTSWEHMLATTTTLSERIHATWNEMQQSTVTKKQRTFNLNGCTPFFIFIYSVCWRRINSSSRCGSRRFCFRFVACKNLSISVSVPSIRLSGRCDVWTIKMSQSHIRNRWLNRFVPFAETKEKKIPMKGLRVL